LPRFASRLTGICSRVEPPDSRTGLRIDRPNEAADGFRTIDTGDNLALRREPSARRGAVTVTRIVVGGLERLRTVFEVDGVDFSIRRENESLVVVEYEPATESSGGSWRNAFGHLVAVLPEEIACRGIKGVDDATGHGEIHDTVVDNGAGPIIHIR